MEKFVLSQVNHITLRSDWFDELQLVSSLIIRYVTRLKASNVVDNAANKLTRLIEQTLISRPVRRYVFSFVLRKSLLTDNTSSERKK